MMTFHLLSYIESIGHRIFQIFYTFSDNWFALGMPAKEDIRSAKRMTGYLDSPTSCAGFLVFLFLIFSVPYVCSSIAARVIDNSAAVPSCFETCTARWSARQGIAYTSLLCIYVGTSLRAHI